MKVTVGQKYRPARTVGPKSLLRIWRVVELFQAPDGIAHARLVADDSRVDRKTVSCTALADVRLYNCLDA